MFLKLFLLSLASASVLFAQSLRFTAVSVDSTNRANLNISGPSNLVCVLERAAYSTNFTWETVTNYTLSGSGTASLVAALRGNTNAVFRTRSTNNSYFSTNAAGVYIGYCRTGFDLVGNPYGYISSFTNIFPEPLEGLTVYLWNGTGYNSWDYTDGEWSGSDYINPVEGFYVASYSTNQIQRYVIASLFETNSVNVNIGTNYALLCSQRFWPLDTSANPAPVDLLQSGRLGGYSQLPVQGTSSNGWTHIQKWDYSSQALNLHGLTNGVWRTGTNAANVTLYNGEGFFFQTATNSTWTVNRFIWP